MDKSNGGSREKLLDCSSDPMLPDGVRSDRDQEQLTHLRERLAEAEAALRNDRDDARFVLESIPQLVWRSASDGRWTWGGPQWTSFTGQSDQRSRNRGWLDAVHPDDRARTQQAWHAASEQVGGPRDLAVEHRLRRERDGVYRWFRTRAVPRHDQTGALEWFGTSTDVHDIKVLQERERLLVIELQTRVRASLAMVRGLVRRLDEVSEEGRALELRLGSRLDALARVQSAVIRDPFAGIDLRELILEEMRLAGLNLGGRVRLTGPRALLRPQAAEAVALALHELVANAARHGALRQTRGRLVVMWESDEASGLRLEWAETGMSSTAAPPEHRGFGFKMLTQALPRELKATAGLEFSPGGLTYRVDLPPACCAPGTEAPEPVG